MEPNEKDAEKIVKPEAGEMDQKPPSASAETTAPSTTGKPTRKAKLSFATEASPDHPIYKRGFLIAKPLRQPSAPSGIAASDAAGRQARKEPHSFLTEASPDHPIYKMGFLIAKPVTMKSPTTDEAHTGKQGEQESAQGSPDDER